MPGVKTAKKKSLLRNWIRKSNLIEKRKKENQKQVQVQEGGNIVLKDDVKIYDKQIIH